MSMGVFMPPPAPLMTGGGGGGLDGMITVGNYFDFVFGCYEDTINGIEKFGSLSGDAAPYFMTIFFWIPPNSQGTAVLSGPYDGASLVFQGVEYFSSYHSPSDSWIFLFGPEVASWPTSGTHPFTLTLP